MTVTRERKETTAERYTYSHTQKKDTGLSPGIGMEAAVSSSSTSTIIGAWLASVLGSCGSVRRGSALRLRSGSCIWVS